MHRDGGIRTATGEYDARVLGEQTETLTGHPIQRFVWLRRLIGVRASAAASFGGRLGWAGDILLESGGHVWLRLRWRVTELMFLEARDAGSTDVHNALSSEERESKSVGSRDGCLDRRGPWAALFTRTYPIRMQPPFPFTPHREGSWFIPCAAEIPPRYRSHCTPGSRRCRRSTGSATG